MCKKLFLLLLALFGVVSTPVISQRQQFEFITFEKEAIGEHHLKLKKMIDNEGIIEFEFSKNYFEWDSLEKEYVPFMLDKHLIKGSAQRMSNDYVSPYFLENEQKSCYLYKAYNDSIEVCIYLSIWNDIAYIEVKSLSDIQSKKLISRDILYSYDTTYSISVYKERECYIDSRTTEFTSTVIAEAINFDYCLIANLKSDDGVWYCQGLEIKKVTELEKYKFRLFTYRIDDIRGAIDSLIIFEGTFRPKAERGSVVREIDYSPLYERINFPAVVVFSQNFCNHGSFVIECELSINDDKANVYGADPEECISIPSSVDGVMIFPWVTLRSNSLSKFHNLPIDDKTVILRYSEYD